MKHVYGGVGEHTGAFAVVAKTCCVGSPPMYDGAVGRRWSRGSTARPRPSPGRPCAPGARNFTWQFAALVTANQAPLLPPPLPGYLFSFTPLMKRLMRCVYGRNRTVSPLNEVRNSAANCGSLFWMNELGNHVYRRHRVADVAERVRRGVGRLRRARRERRLERRAVAARLQRHLADVGGVRAALRLILALQPQILQRQRRRLVEAVAQLRELALQRVAVREVALELVEADDADGTLPVPGAIADVTPLRSPK